MAAIKLLNYFQNIQTDFDKVAQHLTTVIGYPCHTINYFPDGILKRRIRATHQTL
jgi:hypothetical protein